ncbi:MAG: ComEC/Rec2 family competence protein, partial [Deltaproteobacteria bacterium]|nr:ComEC/Rec2 family competence protein [Deltaproteobacteria bacterium]
SRWARAGEGWHDTSGRVRVRFPGRAPSPGTPVLVTGRARPVGGSVLPGEPDPVRGATRSRIHTEVRAARWARLGGRSRAADRFSRARHGGVFRALVTGDRSGVDPATWLLLRRTGTAHLLAISGFHVGLVALAAALGVRVLLRAGAVLRPEGFSEAPAWIVGAIVGVGYAVFVGAPHSAQRAAGLLLLLCLARVLGRKPAPLHLLAVVAAMQLAVDPAAIASPGFQLSYGAIVGMVQVTPRLLAYLPPDTPRPVTWAVGTAAATVGATVGTLPAAAWWFQEVAPLSPVANLFAMPAVALGILPCAAVAGFGPEFLAVPALWVADLLFSTLCAVLGLLAVSPWTPAVGPMGALLLCALLLVPRRPGLCMGVLMVALGLRVQVHRGLVVTVLDVGQGQAVLVEHADGRRWLVDGGRPGRRVLKWLRRQGVRDLDVVVATDLAIDHTGGLVPVLEELEVDQLWLPAGREIPELEEVAGRRGIPIIRQPEPCGGSLAVTAGTGRAWVLFPGDLRAEGEGLRLPASPPAVLLVPRHGSRALSHDAVLRAGAPRIGVISAGRANPFGHPHPEVLERYRMLGVALFRTDHDGTVRVHLRDDRAEVRSWRPGAGWRSAGAWDLSGGAGGGPGPSGP